MKPTLGQMLKVMIFMIFMKNGLLGKPKTIKISGALLYLSLRL